MGHLVEIVIIAGITLAIFGPKALQNIARNAGKGVSQANSLKEKIMADMPIQEIRSVAETVSNVPTNPAHAMQMMMKRALLPEEKASEKTVEPVGKKAAEASSSETKSEV